MNTIVLRRRNAAVPGPIRHRAPLTSDAAGYDGVVTELSAALFAEFRRKDQRMKAEQYLRGLLFAEGRKSIRNIAAHVGGAAAEQALHHFISSSTWDWQPMRAALAGYLERSCTPRAWVVRSLHIPKAGEHSVGVDRLFAPQLGQMFRGQQAFGVWFASEELSAPVNWRLMLPDQWVNDHERRDRAEVPEGLGCESQEECAASVAIEAAQNWGVTRRPVLLDLRGSSVRPTLARLAAARVPVLGRIGASCRLTVADRAMPGFGAGPLPAQQILESTKGLRRPVHWLDPAAGRTSRTSLASVVRVSLLNPQTGRQRPMLLLGEWHDPQRPPVQVWLTDLTNAPVAPLLRLTKLTRRVEQDFAEVGEEVGLRDFVGRSFRGWHRHITLASAAHAARVLSAGDDGLGLDLGLENAA
ncbi:IS701 family transposase [Streptomyces luteolus]|uniref:Transposase n=1 Tax=Streptomyces luteolus TaxID=3043615 RepID=A0ABT6T7Y6_9ACTN|nr:transposase [Streptomyces sp. B-S-A12]MDI3422952.1 transposase [Streptomyces sp. B-S-A12]